MRCLKVKKQNMRMDETLDEIADLASTDHRLDLEERIDDGPKGRVVGFSLGVDWEQDSYWR